MLIALQPLAATRWTSLTAVSISHCCRMASGMKRPGCEPATSSIAQSLYALIAAFVRALSGIFARWVPAKPANVGKFMPANMPFASMSFTRSATL